MCLALFVFIWAKLMVPNFTVKIRLLDSDGLHCAILMMMETII